MLSSFNVNRSHSTNLMSHFVDWSLDNCLLMSVVMVLVQGEYGMLIKILSSCYSKAESWPLALFVHVLPILLTLQK